MTETSWSNLWRAKAAGRGAKPRAMVEGWGLDPTLSQVPAMIRYISAMSRKHDSVPPRLRLSPIAAMAVSVFLLPVGCAKVDTAGGGGTGSTTGSGGIRGTGTGGSGVGTGSGGIGRGEGDGGLIMADSGTTTCQEGMYMYVPQIPTVYLMVDRSGSMFDCLATTNPEPSCTNMTDTSWVKLRDGILQVVQSLQKDVRFGFTSYTGTNPRLGGMCPILSKVAPALDNYDAIAKVYNGLAFQPNTTEAGKKFESPASQSLSMIGAELLADQAPGAKYILYVTDGEPDYCGDGNSLCPPDGVVGSLQKLKAQGITTIIFGLKSQIGQDLPLGVLEAFANAGAGEPTMAPLRTATSKVEDIYDQCYNTGATSDDAAGGWTREFMATGKPMTRGQTIGTYSTTAGPTLPYKPDVTNQQMLVNQLSQALAGVKSCAFDLNNLNGKSLKVDLNMLAAVTVNVQGSGVPLDSTNGWKMNGTSELELVGTACSNWRMPQNTMIDIKIPCQAIIIE